MIWTVGSTPFNMEMKCLNDLKENEIEAFVPLAKHWTKPARKKKAVLTTRKLFPGYIFLRIDRDEGLALLKRKNIKVSPLYVYDRLGQPQLSELKEPVVRELLERNEIGDLFDDFDKKTVRKHFERNQLVCWREGLSFALGFVAKHTKGKPEAYVKIASGKELKISVAMLSLL